MTLKIFVQPGIPQPHGPRVIDGTIKIYNAKLFPTALLISDGLLLFASFWPSTSAKLCSFVLLTPLPLSEVDGIDVTVVLWCFGASSTLDLLLEGVAAWMSSSSESGSLIGRLPLLGLKVPARDVSLLFLATDGAGGGEGDLSKVKMSSSPSSIWWVSLTFIDWLALRDRSAASGLAADVKGKAGVEWSVKPPWISQVRSLTHLGSSFGSDFFSERLYKKLLFAKVCLVNQNQGEAIFKN